MRLLAFLAALLLATPLPAQQDTPLEMLDSRDEGRGWAAVGRLDFGTQGFCTATLVAPDRVLTAAHCVFDSDTGALRDPREITFLAGWRTGRAEAIRGVTRVAVWPGFDLGAGTAPGNVGNDIALLALDRPVRSSAIPPFEIGREAVARGARVAVVSYARERTEAPSIQETCHVLEQRHDGVSVLSCDIDRGASGAPVFAAQGDALRIVSVISATLRDRATPMSLGVRLGDRVEALERVLDGDLPGDTRRMPQGARATARFVRP